MVAHGFGDHGEGCLVVDRRAGEVMRELDQTVWVAAEVVVDDDPSPWRK